MIRLVLIPFFIVLFAPGIAWAVCSNPAGVKGEIIYNDDFNKLQFCDGTDWVGLGGSGTGTGVTDGDKGDVTVSGSGASWMIDDDVLDFTEFKDQLTLDANTDILIENTNFLSITNTGTGNSLVVNDQASDTDPFVIDAAGKVGIGIALPTQALDVVGRATANSLLVKATTGAAAPLTGVGGGATWATDGTHTWRASGNVGVGVTSPTIKLQVAGPIVSNVNNSGSATSINFSLSNAQYTSAACGAFTLSNIADGGNYTLLVTGNGTGPATFTHSGLTIKTTGTLTCTASKMTLFGFQRYGTNLFVTMVTGY